MDLPDTPRTLWSPLRFDPDHVLPPGAVTRLLDAARWSPSAGNSQPWSFVPAVRGDDVHRRLVPLLTQSSRRWAPDASLLVVNVCHRYVAETDWDSSEFAEYDLGQAVAHLSFEAQAMGLHVRQFRAFDRDGVQTELALPAHWVAMTMAAIGRPPADAPAPARSRRSVADVVWSPPLDQ